MRDDIAQNAGRVFDQTIDRGRHHTKSDGRGIVADPTVFDDADIELHDVTEGQTTISRNDDYTSENTYRLSVEETKRLLMRLPEMQKLVVANQR